ncbi:hypothetical protein [Streptomyces marincola]|uniref:hypothetical protein n=1 Tax=Streptomyces marincola TaxID=2878388 RepID=UPI0038502E09
MAYLHGEHANTFRGLGDAGAAGLRTPALARQVKSSRCVEAVQDLRQRMRPFGRHRLVADFEERAARFATAA